MMKKLCALFGRALPRDFLDVDAAVMSGRYTRGQLLALAAEADHGFDRLLFADALGALTQITRPRWRVPAFGMEDFSERAVAFVTRHPHAVPLELIGGVLAAARNDQHAPPGEAHDDADERQRCRSKGGTVDLGRRPGGDERESAQRDKGDTPHAQAARTALTSAGAPSCAVPHRHRLRILRGWPRPPLPEPESARKSKSPIFTDALARLETRAGAGPEGVNCRSSRTGRRRGSGGSSESQVTAISGSPTESGCTGCPYRIRRPSRARPGRRGLRSAGWRHRGQTRYRQAP